MIQLKVNIIDVYGYVLNLDVSSDQILPLATILEDAKLIKRFTVVDSNNITLSQSYFSVNRFSKWKVGTRSLDKKSMVSEISTDKIDVSNNKYPNIKFGKNSIKEAVIGYEDGKFVCDLVSIVDDRVTRISF